MYIEFPSADVKIEGMEGVTIPPMIQIRQKYDTYKIENLASHLRSQLEKLDNAQLAGKQICITAGSRGIPHMALLYRTVCDFLRERGASPFLVPAMGSHGSATAEGQLEVLVRYGITEETMGAPVLSSMDVVEYAQLDNGTPLYCDSYAARADGILIMHKVKPHTDYRARHESGLAKMIAIGISKHKGATEFHKLGFEHFAQRIPECAQLFLEHFPVIGGVGIVQNAYDEICTIEAATAEKLLDLDARLLEEAKAKIPKFKFQDLDLLIIDQIGKEISGFGADPNVTGRTNGIAEDFQGVLNLNKLFIAGLTEQTHHNGAGIGGADITTRRCLNSIDWTSTWTNIITSSRIKGACIPMYMNTDQEAIRLGIRSCTAADFSHIRVARIKNTLELNEILVSPALYKTIKDRADVELLQEAREMAFDEEGFLLPF